MRDTETIFLWLFNDFLLFFLQCDDFIYKNMYNMYITLSVGFHAVLSHIEGTNANKGNIAGKNIKKRTEMREKEVHWDSWKYYIWSQTDNNNNNNIILIVIRKRVASGLLVLVFDSVTVETTYEKKSTTAKNRSRCPMHRQVLEATKKMSQYKHTNTHIRACN